MGTKQTYHGHGLGVPGGGVPRWPSLCHGLHGLGVPPILKATASVVAVMVQSFSTSTAFTGGGGGGGLGVELVAVSVCLLCQVLGLCMVWRSPRPRPPPFRCGGLGLCGGLPRWRCASLEVWRSWPRCVVVFHGLGVMVSTGGGGHGGGGWCAAPRPVPQSSISPVPPRWCASVVAVMVSVVSWCLLHVSHMVPTVAVVS